MGGGQKTSWWERGHFRPSRNRNLTHKKRRTICDQNQLILKSTQLQHHTDFRPKSPGCDTLCGVSRGFFQLVLKLLVLSCKTYFCILENLLHISFELFLSEVQWPNYKYFRSAPNWRVQWETEVWELCWQLHAAYSPALLIHHRASAGGPAASAPTPSAVSVPITGEGVEKSTNPIGMNVHVKF